MKTTTPNNNQSKMTPVTNNKDLRDEENNHHHGHEIILHSMPNEDEMPANHPEDDEEQELDKEDEMEMHPDAGNTNRWRPGSGWSRSRALTAFLAAAGVGVVVGGGSVVFLAARGKSSISSSKQAAVATDLLIDDYIEFGDGVCLDGADKRYAYVEFPRVSDPDECAANCECAQGIKGVQLRGFTITTRSRHCACFVDWLNPLQTKDQEKIAKLNDKCDAAGSFRDYYDGLLGATILLSGTTSFDCVNSFPGKWFWRESKNNILLALFTIYLVII